MVNNYNSEWIRAWNGNLDLQITLDHFAIVTYICDYMMKDDSGTMEFIRRALKDSENEQMKEKLKIVKNQFQTHRQIGEAEAVYRIFPSMHLASSNIATLFVHTGFRKNRSKMLREITQQQANDRNSEVITLEDYPEKIFELTVCMEDRYDERPESLSNISLAQFAKRYTLGGKSKEQDEEIEDEEDANDKVARNNDKDDDDDEEEIEKNVIIAYYLKHRIDLPSSIKIGGKNLRLRRPIALRFHKYKQIEDPHQHYLSLLRLYQPHTVKDLDVWENDQQACINAYHRHKQSIDYVKSKVMKYQDKVEKAQAEAQSEYDQTVGDMLDAAKEQNETDCADEGVHENDRFVALDPENAPLETVQTSEARAGAYRAVELISLDELITLSRGCDSDQRAVVSLGVEFAQNMRKTRYRNIPSPKAPLIVVQGGAGSGKSFVINLMAQWIERILRTPGDNPLHPYLLRCAFTGCAARLIEGQTLHSAFHLPYGNDQRLMGDKLLDEKRTTLKNLQVTYFLNITSIPFPSILFISY